jgi:hypothetical protein
VSTAGREALGPCKSGAERPLMHNPQRQDVDIDLAEREASVSRSD